MSGETWTWRDFPVLQVVAGRMDRGEQTSDREVTAAMDLSADEVMRALVALDGTYITGKGHMSLGSATPVVFTVTGLTERGRRAVGLWPSGEASDALVEALRQAEGATEDPEEKTMLRRAAGAVGSVSREVMTDVMAAVIKSQVGL